MSGVVVVGGGLAAGTCVTELRSRGYDGPVTIVAEEPHPPYERPPLSKDLLLGNAEADGPLVHPADWYDEHDVVLRTGTRVSAVDLAARQVVVDGVATSYETLLLATGARPRRLPLADASGAPVAYLRTLDDALRLRELLTAGTRIGIVGAGWIGLEVAAAARSRDVDVTVLESADQPLLRVVGPEVGAIFAALHREHGVDLRTSVHLTGIEESRGRAVVHLEEDDPAPFDLLVVGIGVEPVVELADAAGLRTDDGIRTDAHLRTSDPHVYAAGDVANADHPRLGRPVRVEHWDTAIKHGTVVAANVLGTDTVADALPYFFTDQYDLGMEYVGSPGPEGFDRVLLRGDVPGRVFTAWWLRGDEVVAGMHVNDWDAIEDVRRIVGTRVVPERLSDGDVGLDDVQASAD
jgi:3-phenylpropionate/trans-cinnamate dioxygenase ferredoxin reductase subunit